MKFLLVNNNVVFEDGNKRLVYRETGNFFLDIKQQGHQVEIFQFTKPLGNNSFMANFDLSTRGFGLHLFKRKYRLFNYFTAFFRLLYLVGKVDFVYLFYPGGICSVIAILCILRGTHFGFYIRGEKGILGSIPKFLYKKSKVILTISPQFTEKINQFGVNARTIRPMMGITENELTYKKEFDTEKVRFLYVGRVERDKGILELFEAITRLDKETLRREWSLDIVGYGTEFEECKQLVKSNELQKRIVFHGTVESKERLISIYKNCNFFVFPSHHEGFPRVLYEAMILGVPIATTMVGSISYLMKDKFNCHEIKVKDANQLSDLLGKVINDYPKYCSVAANASKTIVDYLSDKKSKHSQQLIQIIS